MVGRSVMWSCDKCRSEYFSYDEAHRCELGHIVNEAAEKVRADIAEIFANQPTVKVKRKAQP